MHVLIVLLFTSVPENGLSVKGEETPNSVSSETAIKPKIKPEKQKLPKQQENKTDLVTKKKKRKLANDSETSGNYIYITL